MYKVREKLMPNNIVCLFEDRDQTYHLRGEDMFKNLRTVVLLKVYGMVSRGVILFIIKKKTAQTFNSE